MKLNKVGGKVGDVVALPDGPRGRVVSILGSIACVLLDSGARRVAPLSQLTLVRRATGRRSGLRKCER